MFKSLWNKIVAFVKEVKAVVKSIFAGDWANCSLGHNGNDEIMPVGFKDFSWIKWFKGEYRQPSKVPFDGLFNLVLGFGFNIATVILVTPALAGVFGGLTFIPAMLIGMFVGRLAQAVYLKFDIDAFHARPGAYFL